MNREQTDTFWQAVMNGYHDRAAYGLLRVEQLYRSRLSLQLGWRLGWEIAHRLCRTPLRTKAKPYKAPRAQA